ncbi:MAG TPA: hypothetical protein VMF32_12690 [Xanthobacteraceae bacterium]|nr:hypothetical protein [Xanthobacteraceae bacterium]
MNIIDIHFDALVNEVGRGHLIAVHDEHDRPQRGGRYMRRAQAGAREPHQANLSDWQMKRSQGRGMNAVVHERLRRVELFCHPHADAFSLTSTLAAIHSDISR